ncbi:MAG: hypothetical protein ACYTEX_24340, partial [Planctomycetota bacterium]
SARPNVTSGISMLKHRPNVNRAGEHWGLKGADYSAPSHPGPEGSRWEPEGAGRQTYTLQGEPDRETQTSEAQSGPLPLLWPTCR